jgi:hypothetical protein
LILGAVPFRLLVLRTAIQDLLNCTAEHPGFRNRFNLPLKMAGSGGTLAMTSSRLWHSRRQNT